MGHLRSWPSLYHYNPSGPRNCKSSYLNPLLSSFLDRIVRLDAMSKDELIALAQVIPGQSLPTSLADLQYFHLCAEYPSNFLKCLLYVKDLNYKASRMKERASAALSTSNAPQIEARQSVIDSWPQVIDENLILRRCEEYISATTITVPRPCVCCGRSFFSDSLSDAFTFSFEQNCIDELHPLSILRADPHLASEFTAPFTSLCPILDGLMLYHIYVVVSSINRILVLQLCHDCNKSLSSHSVPKYSLRNDLYRGTLPADLQDITWIEEKVCALHRVSADVARLFNAEHDESLPYRLVGNTCAYPTNILSTARILPRTPADVNGSLTVVFVGASFKAEKLPPMFRVRRRIIARLLSFLAMHNPLYSQIPISEELLNLYPEDGVLPLLEESVVLSPNDRSSDVLAQETASFEAHPATTANGIEGDTPNNSHPGTSDVIESTGVIDFDGTTFSGHSATAAALYNLVRPRHEGEKADLIMPHGSGFVKEYDNPSLLPGMFPTLFPYGTGALEADRQPPISFQDHSNYLLSLHNPEFKHHRLFMFVVLGIMKRRRGHLFTSFAVKKPGFRRIAFDMASISADVLKSTAAHLENNRQLADLSPEQQKAYDCVKQLNVVTSHIPGSPAAKLVDRSAIMAYYGLFGLQHIFLTMNYPAVHSPIFQVFVGNEEVDLAAQFPKMPFPKEKALRLAKNPVAAADFFIFCMRMFFKHLLGYDMVSGESQGGILGHLQAHYGKAECTLRGVLHGHHSIWLLGGLNPTDVHQRLETDPDFKARFFAFWEQVIMHEKPIPDYEPPTGFEPRSERPLPLRGKDRKADFDEDVSACAEFLQRHECNEVCWKYKNVSHLPRSERPCRFLYPHGIVTDSHYDAETKSVMLKCNDPTINYFNPYILAMCRHNHDIKCVLSGKSAKASMFYITNYITKDDIHTHHILSLMSSTIAHMREDENASPIDRAKARLQRWVSQLSRAREIHAQQAVLYIRGHNDSFYSHETIPMLSRNLLAYVKRVTPDNCVSSPFDIEDPNTTSRSPHVQNGTISIDELDDGSDSENDDSETAEEPSVPIYRSEDGLLYQAPTQVDDYLHRDQSLHAISFYEFVCCFRKESKKNSTSQRLGTLPRFNLLGPHSQASSMLLVQHQDPSLPWHMWKKPPRLVGMKVPRRNSPDYHVFMIAHFKPFSALLPLKLKDESYVEAFDAFDFSPFARRIMKNWEEIHECEDQRDAERMRRKQREAKSNEEVNSKLTDTSILDFIEGEGPLVDIDSPSLIPPNKLLRVADLLKTGGWFQGDGELLSGESDIPPVELFPSTTPDKACAKRWDLSLKLQESNIRHQRLNCGTAPTQLEYTEPQLIPETLRGCDILPSFSTDTQPEPPPTIAMPKDAPVQTADALIHSLGKAATLNKQQWLAYLIVARKFVENEEMFRQNKVPNAPLRLLLTGPGGTGKSHVVQTLKRLMAHYGAEHKLRLLAPTGSAAQGIDASTIHKSLGIQVKRRQNAKGTNLEDYVGRISKNKMFELETDWKDAEYLFCDEMSMIGADLLAQIDQVLRLIKGNDSWFGGVNVIFAGDFAQYRPVGAQALYEPITVRSGSKTMKDLMNRLGRMAWKSINSVVELREQMRMHSDPEYGAAVGRLRLRQCTEDDIVLFNSRVLRSHRNLDGVSISPTESLQATMIVADNKLRIFLNTLKAKALFHPTKLVMCAARDMNADGSPLKDAEQIAHITHDFASVMTQGALPSMIPLAVGMKVVLRKRNISPELKISNGSAGIVRALFNSQYGQYTCADGAIVYFPSSPIQLPNLPEGCIFIQPVSTSYHTLHNGTKRIFRRRQIPIEPAFTVTGHFAQGKTLPVVVADLKQPDPAATYVIASRATSRNGIFLTEKVSLKDLNRSLPRSLKKELERLETIEHNTAVLNGFLDGPLWPIKDEEQVDANNPLRAKLNWDVVGSTKTRTKSHKKGTQSVPANLSSTMRLDIYPHPYLCWDSRNYSCAYDSIITPLYAIWHMAPLSWKQQLASESPRLSVLNEAFSQFSRDAHRDMEQLHETRESVRDTLSSIYPTIFPRTGACQAPMDALLSHLGLLNVVQYCVIHQCDNMRTVTRLGLRTIFLDDSARCLGGSPQPLTTVEDWFHAQLSTALDEESSCATCCQPLRSTQQYKVINAPPLLVVENSLARGISTKLVPGCSIELRSQDPEGRKTYTLRGVLYHGSAHYTARIFLPPAYPTQANPYVMWNYDGMTGAPSLEGTFDASSEQLLTCKQRSAIYFLYRLEAP